MDFQEHHFSVSLAATYKINTWASKRSIICLMVLEDIIITIPFRNLNVAGCPWDLFRIVHMLLGFFNKFFS